ncbi:MAG TPA: DUF1573 domain-containing protein [Phycisphaerales bacterium]|nr:DUF1573 domain-containing protein [Phycisphaerales bacterium]
MRAPTLRPLCLGSALLASSAFAGLALASAGPPLISVVETDEPDRGVIAVGLPVRRVVVLSNGSTKAVQLRVVRKSCGCIEAKLSREALAPGEFAELELSGYSTEAAVPQRHAAEVAVLTLDESGVQVEAETHSIGMSYTPDIEAVILPPFVVMRARAGDTRSGHDVWIRRVDGRPAKLARLDLPETWLTAQPLAHHENHTVLRLEPGTRVPGLYRGLLHVAVASDQSGEHAPIDVSLRVLPSATARPAGIIIRTSGAPEPVVLTVRVRCHSSDTPPTELRLSGPFPATLGPLRHEEGQRLVIHLHLSTGGSFDLSGGRFRDQRPHRIRLGAPEHPGGLGRSDPARRPLAARSHSGVFACRFRVARASAGGAPF